MGMDACPIEVETDLGWGLPAFSIVGLPDAAVRESRERVRAGMANSGFEFPSAAHHRQSGSGGRPQGRTVLRSAHRPVAAGRLRTAERGRRTGRWASGAVQRRRRALARRHRAAHQTAPCPSPRARRRAGHRGVLLPAANAAEAALVEGDRGHRRREPDTGGGLPRSENMLSRRRAVDTAALLAVEPHGIRTSPTSKGRSTPAGRSRSAPPAATTCS